MARVSNERVAAWTGFSCKQCGAPLVVQRAADATKAGELSARGWRVTCTCCGMTEFYEPGTTMRGIGFST